LSVHIQELFNLSNKVAIVTGGAGWLGSAVSESLAQAGAIVVIVDKDAGKLCEITNDFSKDLDITGIAADVMEDKSLRMCINRVVSKHGRLDILVNCAVAGSGLDINNARFEDFDAAFHNGPAAYAIASQQAAIHMRKTGGGVIINLGSKSGVVADNLEVPEDLPSDSLIAYGSSKAAIIHMTRYMAVYWANDNIRVNCISPGPFPNETIQREMPQLTKRLAEQTPMGRIGKPFELKGVVVFLASDASSYVTGQNILVDGGWTSW